ncbi:threonine aldolase family protein [Pedobacter deserti]|uniref:threonine aldolase family protein n=1 Tax=Pedobacter deserti TaxID=2817382 RepID=UPI00210A4A04|nr:beta-eliminating lyase-related protein [Pedobacter sp. SYSU D00382]
MDTSHTIQSLASENFAGVHPAFLEALIQCNNGHSFAYGADEYTRNASELFGQVFGDIAGVHFTFNGTGANIVSLSSMAERFNAILCADSAHIYNDESTAPESLAGCRLLPVASTNGKIDPAALRRKITRIGNPHAAQISAISITQCTEFGTVYTISELKELIAVAKEFGLLVHMDGARIYNAAASLNCSLAALTSEIGIDVLSLGGTKNGMMFGEAVVFFNDELYQKAIYHLKRATQLNSKMRFISSQFQAMLNGELWREIANHTNNLASRLAEGLKKIPEVQITRPVEANAVFAIFPASWVSSLKETMYFHTWDEELQEMRLVCAFDLVEADIDRFLAVAGRLSATPDIR